eukprot:scpid96138/ scgid21554/ 
MCAPMFRGCQSLMAGNSQLTAVRRKANDKEGTVRYTYAKTLFRSPTITATATSGHETDKDSTIGDAVFFRVYMQFVSSVVLIFPGRARELASLQTFAKIVDIGVKRACDRCTALVG